MGCWSLGTDLHDIDIDSFLHFATDNADHNSRTIDGLHTFHGIGIIACVAKAKKCWLPVIKTTTIEICEIVETEKLKTKFFIFSCDIKRLKMFKDIRSNVALDNTKFLGNMWQYAWLVTFYLWNPCATVLWKYLLMVLVQVKQW